MIACGGSPNARRSAEYLFVEFGSADAAIAASPNRILKVTGGDQAAVDAVGATCDALRHVLRGRIAGRPLLDDMKAVIDYLRIDLAHRPAECLCVLYLDMGCHIIADEIAALGTSDRTAIYPREILARALELGATGIILVHNHPSGDPRPTNADVIATAAIREAGIPLGVELYDHLIVSRDGHASMRQSWCAQ